MDTPINWKDDYLFSKYRIVLTNEQVPIPGVRVLAYHLMNSAIPPLVPHFHENCFEFTVIFEGAFTFHAQNQNYKVSGGDIFVAHPNEVHSTAANPLSHGEIYWFQLDIHSPESLLFLDEAAASNLISRLSRMDQHIVKSDDKYMFHLIERAFRLSLQSANPFLIASYLVLFLNYLTTIPKNTPILSRSIYESLNYIYDNIYSDISLEELAKCSNLSLAQFKTRFKQEVGISPRSFVNIQKIDLAKQLLIEGRSKTDVAICLGFNTSSYFSAVFKRYTFCTPSEYIKKYRMSMNEDE